MPFKWKRGRASVVLGTVTVACTVAGCVETEGVTPEIQALASRVDSLSGSLAVLRFEIRSLREDRRSAEFDPITAEGYQVLNANLGTFAISVSDIAAFGDGSRVTVRVGNLSSATFNGARFSLRYGPSRPDFEADEWVDAWAEWTERMRETEVGSSATMRPGAWNAVTLNLPGVPPVELGHLEVRMTTDQISLQSR